MAREGETLTLFSQNPTFQSIEPDCHPADHRAAHKKVVIMAGSHGSRLGVRVDGPDGRAHKMEGE
jgi:hypothetical protein